MLELVAAFILALGLALAHQSQGPVLPSQESGTGAGQDWGLSHFGWGLALGPESAVLTWYGSEGDGLLGARHGASWHGDACGLPEVVDLEHFGAAAPRWIPYCSRLLVCTEQEGGEGRPVCVIVTVVDRQTDDVLDGRWHVDLWPAAARELGMVEAGIVEGWVWEMINDASPVGPAQGKW